MRICRTEREHGYRPVLFTARMVRRTLSYGCTDQAAFTGLRGARGTSPPCAVRDRVGYQYPGMGMAAPATVCRNGT